MCLITPSSPICTEVRIPKQQQTPACLPSGSNYPPIFGNQETSERIPILDTFHQIMRVALRLNRAIFHTHTHTCPSNGNESSPTDNYGRVRPEQRASVSVCTYFVCRLQSPTGTRCSESYLAVQIDFSFSYFCSLPPTLFH